MAKKLTYEYVKKYIESFGYKLISNDYVNAHSTITLQCPKGHVYNGKYSKFQSGRRCPICSSISKSKIQSLKYEDVKLYIESFGYKLISNSYVNNNQRLLIECDKGHQYYVKFSNFRSGKRCPECANNIKREKRLLQYDYVKNYIESIDGYVLLSDSYINAKSDLKIQCDKGHIFLMSFSEFKSGHRCPDCSKERVANSKRLSYSYVKKQIESEIGYILLSTNYINCNQKLLIKCPEGHIFEKTYDKFRSGQRCPICAESKGELKSRQYFELLNTNFETQYSFDDCKNIEPLRFDFAVFHDIERTKLAFLYEYDGEYHYQPIDGQKKLKYQQKLDNIKNQYCLKNNIPLLRIPYWNFDNIENILLQELNKHNIKI